MEKVTLWVPPAATASSCASLGVFESQLIDLCISRGSRQIMQAG
jgi:hypothetical protein